MLEGKEIAQEIGFPSGYSTLLIRLAEQAVDSCIAKKNLMQRWIVA
jgi:hypothetical protein